MVIDFPLNVTTIDGEQLASPTLKSFLADNEAAPAHVLAAVAALEPGNTVVLKAMGVRVTRPAGRAPRGGRRIARFVVSGLRIDGATSATVLVNRQAGTIGVRLKHRRTLYELPLADVAALIFDRVSRANAGVGKLKGRRPRR